FRDAAIYGFPALCHDDAVHDHGLHQRGGEGVPLLVMVGGQHLIGAHIYERARGECDFGWHAISRSALWTRFRRLLLRITGCRLAVDVAAVYRFGRILRLGWGDLSGRTVIHRTPTAGRLSLGDGQT